MANKLPIDQITKLADDVRLIQDFAENHNFDSSLLTAEVVPVESAKSKKNAPDFPLYILCTSMFLVLASIAVIKFFIPPLSTAVNSFIFLVGLLFTVIATMSAHMRFKDNIVTGIVAVGLIMVLFIGAGIFTPQEVLDKASDIAS